MSDDGRGRRIFSFEFGQGLTVRGDYAGYAGDAVLVCLFPCEVAIVLCHAAGSCRQFGDCDFGRLLLRGVLRDSLHAIKVFGFQVGGDG